MRTTTTPPPPAQAGRAPRSAPRPVPMIATPPRAVWMVSRAAGRSRRHGACGLPSWFLILPLPYRPSGTTYRSDSARALISSQCRQRAARPGNDVYNSSCVQHSYEVWRRGSQPTVATKSLKPFEMAVFTAVQTARDDTDNTSRGKKNEICLVCRSNA